MPKTSTTAALTAKFEVGTGMEAEVAAMLRQAGVHSDQAVQEAEEALALKVWQGGISSRGISCLDWWIGLNK